MDRKEILAIFVLSVIAPGVTVGTLHSLYPPEPEHLEWCEQIEYRSNSCILDHWPGRLKLIGIGLGTFALVGFFTLGAQADVDRRFRRFEARHKKE